jgi:uncharacterized phage protein gp47/JayE
VADYVRPPLVVDPSDMRDRMIRNLEARIPGWLPNIGSLDTALLEVHALENAALHEIASSVMDSIFRTAGASLFGLQPLDATFATADTTWTMIDAAGYTIPAGTEVKVQVTGSDAVGFEVIEQVTVPPGSTATAAGEVQVAALVEGAAGSGLSGAMLVVTPLDGVASIAIVGVTQGGRDAEEDADYLNRLVRRIRRRDRLVLPIDVEEAARDIPGVARALAIDNYIPAGPGGTPAANTAAPGALTVVAIDSLGETVSGAVKADLLADLNANVETGFVFYAMDPTYTTVNVTFTFTLAADSDAAVVETAAEAAVTAYLFPGSWGLPPGGDVALWLPKYKVRFGELYAVLNAVAGLDEVESLLINGAANTDLTLGGTVARLPRPGTITGTAV